MDLLLIPDYITDGGLVGGGMMEEPWPDTRHLGKRKHWTTPDTLPPKKHIGEQNSWEQVEELAADLDGSCSLSSLNVDLGSSAFQSSDALLALPSLSAFKQELLSPFNNNEIGGGEANGQTSPQRHKQIHSCYETTGMNGGGIEYQAGLNSPQSDGGSSGGGGGVTGNLVVTSSTHTEDCRFQYVLAAATSIATKVNEETLTYLNQGQSYEIKLKKLGDLSEYRGKILKSVVRLVFHERRLQYMERQQLAAWEASHPGDSILEVDLPLSYGLLDLSQHPSRLNTIEFLWEPTKEVGVYIKVNCISTEFTPKKHGGEKGVPFRIQVETYLQSEQGVRHLHTASCQVKVFKLKGADRKHKQDREKIQKRPPIEQEKYQCSYDCTILTDVPLNGENAFPPLLLSSANSPPLPNSDVTKLRQVCSVSKEENSPLSQTNLNSPCDTTLQKYEGVVSPSWSPQETQAWLQTHRYTAHLQTLSSYSGADLLRLSRDNLIQLCGLPDGIRLYNALHARAIPPRLTLYLCVEAEREIYEGVFLTERSKRELVSKVAGRAGLRRTQVGALYLQGPAGLRISVTDDLVAHLPDHAAFTLDIIAHDSASDMYQLLLKRATMHQPPA